MTSGLMTRVDAMEVQDRNDLHEYLSQALIGDYVAYVGNDEFSQRAPFLKSYVVERHGNTGKSIEARFRDQFTSVFTRKDPSLLLAFDKHDVAYFTDAADPRFLAIHTLGRVQYTDPTIDKLTSVDQSGFDKAWIPADLLLRNVRGRMIGFKFGFERGVDGVASLNVPVIEELPESRIHRHPRFRMTVTEDVYAENLFRDIAASDVGIGRRALEHVNFLATDQVGGYIRDVLYSSGKIIGSGTSLNGHYLSVNGMVRRYSEVIDLIESYSLGWDQHDNGWIYVGAPFTLSFPKALSDSILDLESFARSIFRPSTPYRIVGILHNIRTDRIDVEAIDLHTNDPFAVELTKTQMSIYMPKGTCGNVLARLFTNMQHSVASDISLSTGDGELIFSGEGIDAN